MSFMCKFVHLVIIQIQNKVKSNLIKLRLFYGARVKSEDDCKPLNLPKA